MNSTGGVIRRLLFGVFGAAVVAAAATPALAHPFGPPPTARVAARGNTITIDWSATPDDAVAIGERLGIMPRGSVAAYRQEAAAQVAPSARDEARLSASPRLHAYLTDRITVTQSGRRCDATVPTITDFVHRGARVVVTCPQTVDQATLRITMLHDIHPAYRTVAIGTQTDPAQSVFTLAAPEHSWRFGVEPGGGSRVVPLIAGAAVVAVVVAAFVVRRGGRAG